MSLPWCCAVYYVVVLCDVVDVVAVAVAVVAVEEHSIPASMDNVVDVVGLMLLMLLINRTAPPCLTRLDVCCVAIPFLHCHWRTRTITR